MLMLSTSMTGFNHSFLRRNSLWLWYILETLSQKEQMNRVRRRENFSSEEKKKKEQAKRGRQEQDRAWVKDMKEKKGRDRKLGTEAEEGKRNQYEKVRQQYMQNEKSVEGTRNTTSQRLSVC